MKIELSKRVRPNVEAAPWVIDEIKKLESKLKDANSIFEKINGNHFFGVIIQEDINNFLK